MKIKYDTVQKITLLVVEIIIWGLSIYFIVPNVKWQVSVGLFLFVWANNMAIVRKFRLDDSVTILRKIFG